MEIVNIVASGKLSDEISLEKLVMNSDKYELEYDPEVHQGAYIRFSSGSPLISIYGSGKYIIRATSSKDLEKTNNKLNNYLQKRNLGKIEENSFSVSNYVFTDDVDQEINLDKISLENENTEHTPEQFPGMIFRTEDATGLVFRTGKIVISGAKSKESARKTLKKIKDTIDDY